MTATPPATAGAPELALLARRFDALAALSDPGAGVTRLAYDAMERRAHELLVRWAAEDGAEAHTDRAGNTSVVHQAGEPYVAIGSHLDSVPNGGRYDGSVGVLTGLEVGRRLREEVGVGLRTIAFAAEEGARFGRPSIGSALACGALTADELGGLRDVEGVSVEEAAREVELDPAALEPWVHADAMLTFLEVHIEQGPVLGREGARLGVVDAVAGSVRLLAEIEGRPEHSGTTPMRLRRDALAGAAEAVLAVETIATASRDGVATVGRLDLRPNSVTTIPGSARFTVDVRDVDPARQRSAAGDVRTAIATVCARRGLSHRVAQVGAHDPVMLSAWPRLALAQAASATGLPWRIMPSGAGHDAAVVARSVPAAMLFIPCVDGLSHVPEEDIALDDVALAVRVVADAVRELDRTWVKTATGDAGRPGGRQR